MSTRRPTLSSALIYRDPVAAIDFLVSAFGFKKQMIITDADGRLAHSELRFESDGAVMVSSAWHDKAVSPADIDGRNTQSVRLHLAGDIDAHCERARRAGARILQAPADQFYGDRTYRAVDPEGHIWVFAKTVREVTREEAEQASGLRIKGWV